MRAPLRRYQDHGNASRRTACGFGINRQRGLVLLGNHHHLRVVGIAMLVLRILELNYRLGLALSNFLPYSAGSLLVYRDLWIWLEPPTALSWAALET